ncbi:hypothetical protein BBJ28_00021231 [Nothophytophthora sp. Chile5]|nr:hypothetical protein BBJ28_00021231 [Nothophytophthora sp. Chile5]
MDESTRLLLEEPSNVIVVDRLNYVLQTGATVNVMSMNAHELLERQNSVIAGCGRSRSGLPAEVMATLTIPYAPEEIVPLIHPDTIQVVAVRRQHVVQCEMQPSGKTTLDVFSDQPEPRITPAADSAVDSGLGNIPITGKRVHNAIAHPSRKGTNPQSILESSQQAKCTRFLATSPVLRALYDFSFGLRGQSIMHFWCTTAVRVMEATEAGANMTDFLWKRVLESTSQPVNISTIVDDMKTLHIFPGTFFPDRSGDLH